MPKYSYRGRNQRGEVMTGEVDSPSSQAAAFWMISVGITPIDIKSQELAEQYPQWLKALLGLDKLADVDLLLFTRQMGTLVKAGVPMMQALEGIQRSTTKQAIIEILDAVRSDLDKGLELSAALAKHPKSFNEFYVSMVRVGEASGQLEVVFRRLFEQLQFDKNMRQKIKSATRYPMFVFFSIGIAITILNVYVIPTFANIYGGMKAALPPLTKVLIATSYVTVHYWWALLLGIIGLVFAYRGYVKTSAGRYSVDRFKLKVPVLGKIMMKAIMARYAFSFSAATKSGLPLVQTFTLVSRVVDNAFYEGRILQMREGVERGETIFRVAQSSGIFTPLELQMIGVGEETGEIEEMLSQIAKMYEEEVDFEVSRLSQTIEPILIAAMGALVVILMLGIFLPLWDLGQAASRR